MIATFYRDALFTSAEDLWHNEGLTVPLDVRELARGLGIELEKAPMGPEIGAMYLLETDHPPLVIYNSLDKPPRQRFSVAHEIGEHLILTAQAAKTLAPGETIPVDLLRVLAEMGHERLQPVCILRHSLGRTTSEKEKRCDRFAAILLMPHWLVRPEFERLHSNPSGRLAIMCERFGVSHLAMSFRLRELGLGR